LHIIYKTKYRIQYKYSSSFHHFYQPFFENAAFKEIDFILILNEKLILTIEAKPTDAKFSPQLRRFRKAVDGKFPILQVVSRPGIFLRKGPGEYLVGYDRLLLAL